MEAQLSFEPISRGFHLSLLYYISLVSIDQLVQGLKPCIFISVSITSYLTACYHWCSKTTVSNCTWYQQTCIDRNSTCGGGYFSATSRYWRRNLQQCLLNIGAWDDIPTRPEKPHTDRTIGTRLFIQLTYPICDRQRHPSSQHICSIAHPHSKNCCTKNTQRVFFFFFFSGTHRWRLNSRKGSRTAITTKFSDISHQRI